MKHTEKESEVKTNATEAMELAEGYRLHLAKIVNHFFKQYIERKVIGCGNNDDFEILTVLENLFSALEELEFPCPDGFSNAFTQYSFKCLSHRFFFFFFFLSSFFLPNKNLINGNNAIVNVQCVLAVHRPRSV